MNKDARRSVGRGVMTFLIVFLITFAFAAQAHLWTTRDGQEIDARWIMKNPAFSYCCGTEDCMPLQLAPGQLQRTEQGYRVLWNGTWYDFLEPQYIDDIEDNKYHRRIVWPSQTGSWWVCVTLIGPSWEIENGIPKCLFKPPVG